MSKRIAVCTTLAAYVMDDEDTYGAWIRNHEEVAKCAAEQDFRLTYFAALELDKRGIEPFLALTSILDKMRYGTYWTYTLDDGRNSITTKNRLRHLTMGQNLAAEYATASGCEWMLFLAADTMPPDDVIPKLLEMNHPLVGCELPTYCLSGTPVHGYPFPVEEQLISAACIMVRRDVFKLLRWRNDEAEKMSDDPCYRHDAETLLGVKSYVRKDCVARHFPEAVCAIEDRYEGRDMRVY